MYLTENEKSKLTLDEIQSIFPPELSLESREIIAEQCLAEIMINPGMLKCWNEYDSIEAFLEASGYVVDNLEEDGQLEDILDDALESFQLEIWYLKSGGCLIYNFQLFEEEEIETCD